MKSVFDGIECLYAEQLKGKRVTLTIASVESRKIVGDKGREDMGIAISFKETKKKFITSGRNVIRQLALACGTDNQDEMSGKQVVLYPVASSKSISGQAIRIALPEHAA